MSALYISLQMTLNELLLLRMEKFLIRFPAFQKLKDVAVATDVPTIVAEPIEEVVVIVTMFAFVQYRCSSGRVVPPLAAGRSPTDEIKK